MINSNTIISRYIYIAKRNSIIAKQHNGTQEPFSKILHNIL